MCKRTTSDPLVRRFLDDYGLHLLRIPRAGAAVGDVYANAGGRTAPVGNVSHLVDPPFEIGGVERERMADVTGTLSKEIDLEVGLGVLEGFLTAVGAGGVISSVKGAYQRNSARSLMFSFEEPERDHVDVLQLGQGISSRRLTAGNVFSGSEYRFYVATGVARSRSLSVRAASDVRSAAEVGVEVVKVAQVDTSVGVRLRDDGTVTYSGTEPLTFGVELFEVVADKANGTLQLAMPPHALAVRGQSKVLRPRRAELGGPEGDVLLSLGTPG